MGLDSHHPYEKPYIIYIEKACAFSNLDIGLFYIVAKAKLWLIVIMFTKSVLSPLYNKFAVYTKN